MAKHYGDLPCININGMIHITVSGTKCLCGQPYAYGKPHRNDGKSENIIWRDLDAVTCEDCKALTEVRNKR